MVTGEILQNLEKFPFFVKSSKDRQMSEEENCKIRSLFLMISLVTLNFRLLRSHEEPMDLIVRSYPLNFSY